MRLTDPARLHAAPARAGAVRIRLPRSPDPPPGAMPPGPDPPPNLPSKYGKPDKKCDGWNRLMAGSCYLTGVLRYCLEGIGGATAVLDRDPALLGERLDAGRATELSVTRALHAAEGGHGLIADALVVDVDYP